MKTICFLIFLFSSCCFVSAQELYPYSEPASNMPSKSIGVKVASMFQQGKHSTRTMQRHSPELMLGLNKEWMVHVGTSFADMHQSKIIWEGARVYTKYRFLSIDDIHTHFRMAAFAGGGYSRNHLDHNEINIMADQSGVLLGLIATQLWNRFALSGTGSLNEVLNDRRWSKIFPQQYAFSAINYSLSAGYLLLPFEYTSYDQTNLNLYVELLGSRNLNWPSEKYYLDLAPSIQFIFKSTGKLNLGYRFQLSSDIYRLSNNSFMVSYEHLFLNALQRKNRSPEVVE